MPTPFAAIAARANTAAVAHLANATADFGGGVAVDGLLDTDYGDPLGLAAGRRVVFSGASAALASIAPGAALSIGAVAYVVSEMDSDATGWTKLVLRRT